MEMYNYYLFSLADKPAVDEARESGREMLKQFLVNIYFFNKFRYFFVFK